MSTITLFGKAKLALANKQINLESDTFKVMLMGTGFTFGSTSSGSSIANAATYVDYTGVASTELSGSSGYSRQTLDTSGTNVTQSNATITFDAPDVTFASLGAGSTDVQGAIIYQFVSSDSDSRLLAWVDFGGNITPNGNDFVITWNSSGIFSIT